MFLSKDKPSLIWQQQGRICTARVLGVLIILPEYKVKFVRPPIFWVTWVKMKRRCFSFFGSAALICKVLVRDASAPRRYMYVVEARRFEVASRHSHA